MEETISVSLARGELELGDMLLALSDKTCVGAKYLVKRAANV
jgi:hypothetical protein